MENQPADRGVRNQWSPTAGIIGLLLTLGLGMISDFPFSGFFAILFPAPAILGRVIGLFDHVQIWAILPFFLVSAVGDAIWFMMIAETFRLLVRQWRSSLR